MHGLTHDRLKHMSSDVVDVDDDEVEFVSVSVFSFFCCLHQHEVAILLMEVKVQSSLT